MRGRDLYSLHTGAQDGLYAMHRLSYLTLTFLIDFLTGMVHSPNHARDDKVSRLATESFSPARNFPLDIPSGLGYGEGVNEGRSC